MIYLDYAATTPLDPDTLDQMLPYFTDIFANPSSKHDCGVLAKEAVDKARATLAALLGCRPEEIIFTSGASESNNLAVKGVAECLTEPKHFITSEFEHKACLYAMKRLEKWGHRVTYIKPNKYGIVEPESLLNAIEEDTIMVSIMHVNNEIGTIQPIDDFGDICREYGIIFHTDATQSFGKMVCRANANVDMMSISAHKFYGPKGIGALFCRSELEITCQIDGGSQEKGLRSGTTNVPAIVGMAAAAQKNCANMKENLEHYKTLERAFLSEIKKNVPMAYLQGDINFKVPWIQNICFYGIDASDLRDKLGERNICVSKSSACAQSNEASHVLQAIDTPEELMPGAIRFSFGKHNTVEQVRMVAKEVACIVEGLRS